MNAVMTCPVCGTPDSLLKQVNEGHDETWICEKCPAVLFSYGDPASMDRLHRELDPQDTALR